MSARERAGSGPDFWTRWQVQARFGGRCARCGRDGATVHHRKPRGAGGSSAPGINAASNLLWVCGDGTRGCHGWIEQHRVEARASGWLVPYVVDPATIPVRLWDGRVVMLDDDGGWSLP